MGDVKRHTLSVLVDNEAGVLSQVARLFSRKGYNIESFSTGTTDNPEISRMTIEVFADEHQILILSNQLRKLFPVHSLKILSDENAIRRELVLFKIQAEDSEERNSIIQIANIFRAHIVDVTVKTLTLAMIGDEKKIEGFEKVLKAFRIVEFVRTGTTALERGEETIYDETKEKGEFNYGKNVL